MNGFLAATAISFGVIFVAELGDKSQLMALTFATRYRPWPVLVGITIGVGGASNLVGPLVVQRVTRRFGARSTMIGATLVGCLSPILIAVAPGRPVEGFAVLFAAQTLDLIHPLYDVNALTLRQTTTPHALLGRVNATMHVLGRGVIPFGALAGGILGDALGVRPTLLLAAVGIILSAIWLTRSAVRP